MISKNKIPLKFACLLRSLTQGELNYGLFTGPNRALLTSFIEDNVLDYRMIGQQQRRVRCPDSANLARYLHHKFGIADLNNYISFLEQEQPERSEAVVAASDSKLRKWRFRLK